MKTLVITIMSNADDIPNIEDAIQNIKEHAEANNMSEIHATITETLETGD